ncbi:MAG: hypothetical protein ACD_68C00007G0001 [uncultured bacterium]|nr:MAG: hypothetical protein ACD_68C00007G0001 [uncultured bacterium]
MELGEKAGGRVILLMLFFPFSFFFISVYTEALFLFLIVAAFYFARKQKWLASSLFALFASACRPIGFLLIIPLFWEYFQQKNYKFKEIGRQAWWLLLAPFGLFSYMFYLGFKFGHPLLFIKAENIWSRSPDASLFNLWGVFKTYGHDFWQVLTTGQAYFLANSFDLVVWLVFAVLAIVAFVKLRPAYGVLMILLLSAGAITGTLISSTRFVIVLFPAYLVLAKLTKSETAFSLTLALSAIFLGLFAIMFTSGYWVG